VTNDRSIVGDIINFRGLVYAPLNENGVVFLFGKVAEDLLDCPLQGTCRPEAASLMEPYWNRSKAPMPRRQATCNHGSLSPLRHGVHGTSRVFRGLPLRPPGAFSPPAADTAIAGCNLVANMPRRPSFSPVLPRFARLRSAP